MMRRRRARGLGPCLCLLVLGAAAPLSAERIRNHFDMAGATHLARELAGLERS